MERYTVVDRLALKEWLSNILAEAVILNDEADSRGLAHFAQKVDKYNGRTDIELWLLEIKQYLTLFPRAPESQKVNFLKAHMTGEVLQVLGRTYLMDVDDVCNRLSNIYGMPPLQQDLRNFRRQAEDEETYEFLIRMSIAVRNRYEGVFGSKDLRDKYLRRLLAGKAKRDFTEKLYNRLDAFYDPVP